MKSKKHLAILSAVVMAVSASGNALPAYAATQQSARSDSTINLAVNAESFAIAVPETVHLYETASTEDGWEYTATDTAARITGYTGSETSVTVPEKIDGKPVTEIANKAFANNVKLVSVSLGKVQKLGSRVFEGCTNLKEITIPKTVTVAKDTTLNNTGALEDSSIEKVTFEEGIKEIPGYVCYGASALKTVVMPERPEDELTYRIGDYAFYGTALKEISIPQTVTGIGSGAFAGTKIASVVMPDSVLEIGNKVFAECSWLKEVTLSKKLQKMGSRVFADTPQLTEITIPKTVTVAKDTTLNNTGALEDSSIEKVTFEEGIKEIPGYVCYGASALKTVVMPERPEDELTYRIGDYAFYGTALKEISIPQTVTGIGSGAYGKTKIAAVVMPDSVLEIGNKVFAECQWLKEVTLSKKLQKMGSRVFADTPQLTEITIPKTVTVAKDTTLNNTGALEDSSIEKVTFEEGIKEIPGYVCYGASALKTVVMPERPEDELTYRIGDYAFYDTALKEISIPQTVTGIGNCAFAGTKIASVVMPDSVFEIGNKVFAECSWLKEVTLSKKLQKMGSRVFADTPQLTEITIPKTVTVAKDTTLNNTGALEGSSIEKVTFEEGIKGIPGYVCYGASVLNTVVIPESPADELSYRIGDLAFYGTALKEVSIPQSVTEIGPRAFAECAKLTGITIYNPECKIEDKENTIYTADVNGELAFNGTIYGYADSTAQAYAEKYNRKFVVLTEQQVTTEPVTTTAVTTTTTKAPMTTQSTSTTKASTTTQTTSMTKAPTTTQTTSTTKAPTTTQTTSTTKASTTTQTTSTTKASTTTQTTSTTKAPTTTQSTSTTKAPTTTQSTSTTKAPTTTQSTSTTIVTTTVSEPLESDDVWVFVDDETTSKITAYNGKRANVVVPRVHDGKPVTALGNKVFAGNEKIVSVDLGPVTALGRRVFEGCINLKEITIPKTVTIAKDTGYNNNGALEGSSIEKVIFEEGIKNIPGYVCYGASEVKTVVMPERPEDELTYEIGECAFCDTALTKFEIPKTVTKIGSSAFAGTKLASVTLPDSVTEIGNRVFSNCQWLTEVNLSKKLNRMGSKVFEGSTQLTEITIPKTVTIAKDTGYNNNGALEGSSIEKVTFEEGIKNIPGYVCYGATAVKTVVMPERPEDELTYEIGECAFCDTALTKFEIPKTVTKIGSSAFTGTKLASVTLPDSVTEIGNRVFSNCQWLTEVNLSKKLNRMGSKVFEGSAQLTEITIPKTVTIAKDTGYNNNGALEGSSIEKVTFEEGIKNIPGYVCYGATAVKTIVMPERPEDELTYEIGECAFCDTALTKFEIPKTVTKIGSSAFTGTKLASVTLPDSVTEIGNRVFSNCQWLTEVNLSKKLKRMGSKVFEGSAQLTEITIPKTVTIAKDTGYNNNGALEGSSIEKVTFEEGIKGIPGYVCYGASVLNTVVIPEGPADELSYRIGDLAFYGTALKEVSIPQSVTEIGPRAFAECAKLTGITIYNPECKIEDKENTIYTADVNDEFTFNGTIYGYADSTAQAYAEKYNRKFAVISGQPPVKPEIVTGDVDGNNEVSVEDAQLVLNAYANFIAGIDTGLTAAQFKAADVNGDGELSADDAQNILNYYVNILASNPITWDELLGKNK